MQCCECMCFALLMPSSSQSYLSVLGYACIGGNADVVRQVMIYGNMKNKPSEVSFVNGISFCCMY